MCVYECYTGLHGKCSFLSSLASTAMFLLVISCFHSHVPAQVPSCHLLLPQLRFPLVISCFHSHVPSCHLLLPQLRFQHRSPLVISYWLVLVIYTQTPLVCLHSPYSNPTGLSLQSILRPHWFALVVHTQTHWFVFAVHTQTHWLVLVVHTQTHWFVHVHTQTPLVYSLYSDPAGLSL